MRERDIFIVALQHADPSARSAYLDATCAGDDFLRRRVLQLLAQHEKNESFLLDAPAPLPQGPALATIDQSPLESPGNLIGPYKLIEQIGEGGMGTVWMAQQTEPVKRVVALKLIKAGMDSKQVIARFEAERQALALMDHANIARVLDAGTTGAGRPFFVMDLVKGVPITKYCDEHRLTPKQRLELFVPVCQAVQHAHQKGIIHRDLKPSNVLVALYDGKPVPKVIDFGVAKAAGQSLTDKTLVTGFGNIVGTLEYMSPEQAEINQLDIDTRSDIYSLGVLLYELLAGSPPFSRKDLEKAGMLEMLRVIREQEPSKPSTKLSTAEGLPTLAANRGTEPARLTKLVRGELDWIVMKALEKDRNRRYETANGFAMDVNRYLADEPVQAGPPSTTYRLRKFLRRNKGPVLAATLVLLALVSGISGTTLSLIEARRQRDEAQTASNHEKEARVREAARAAAEFKERTRAEGAERQANHEKQIAQAVRDFLQRKLLHLADAHWQVEALLRSGTRLSEARENPTIRDLLDRAAKELTADRIEAQFPNQPLVQAEILHTIGDTYRGIGEFGPAIDHLSRAADLFERHVGRDHEDTWRALDALADTYLDAGRLPEAIRLHEQLRDRCIEKLGPDHRRTLFSQIGLARAYAAADNLTRAIGLLEQARDRFTAQVGADHLDTLCALHALAEAYRLDHRPRDAVRLFEKVWQKLIETVGRDHPDTLVAMNNLALSYQALNDLDKAAALLEEVLDGLQTKLGPNHFDTLRTAINLATTYRQAKKLANALALLNQWLPRAQAKLGPGHPIMREYVDEAVQLDLANGTPDKAEALLKQVIADHRQRLGADDPKTLAHMDSLGQVYRTQQKYELAERLYAETLAGRIARLGPRDPWTLLTKDSLAGVYLDQGKLGQAEALYKELIADFTTQQDQLNSFNQQQNLGALYWRQGKLDRSVPIFEDLLEARLRKLGDEDPSTANVAFNLAINYLEAGRLNDAVALTDEWLPRARARFGLDHPAFQFGLESALPIYERAGQTASAETLLKDVIAAHEAEHGTQHPATLIAKRWLAELYRKQRQYDRAETLLKEVVSGQAATLGDDHADTLSSKANLSVLYWSMGKLTDSVPLFEEVLRLQRQKLGDHHVKTLGTAFNLAVNYRDGGRLADAVQLMDNWLPRGKTKLGLGDRTTRWAVDTAVELYARVGTPAKATPLLRELADYHKAKAGPDSPEYAGQLAELGLNLLEQDRATEAEGALRECLAIRAQKTPDDWNTFNAESMLGGALFGQKKYAEAEPLLLKGYEGMMQRTAKIPPLAKVRLAEAVQRLVALYEATGNTDDAARWRRELELQKK
jgi:serine/threonine protein kinase